jgi:hypothetical protein
MMTDLAKAVEYVTQATAKSLVRPNPAEVKKRVLRLFEEGVDLGQLIAAIIARSHAKELEKVFGLTKHDYLTFDDLNEAEKLLGINEKTDANRRHWEEKFKSGRALYWCPRCGYSGSDEFKPFENGTPHLICYQCGWFADMRYFTRSWSQAERAAYEAELDAKRKATIQSQLTKDREQREQAVLSTANRSEALKAAQTIDAFLFVQMGDDIESYTWDAAESRWMVEKLAQLIHRASAFGFSVTAETLIEFFKSNLQPLEDMAFLRAEFERVMSLFTERFKKEDYDGND